MEYLFFLEKDLYLLWGNIVCSCSKIDSGVRINARQDEKDTYIREEKAYIKLIEISLIIHLVPWLHPASIFRVEILLLVHILEPPAKRKRKAKISNLKFTRKFNFVNPLMENFLGVIYFCTLKHTSKLNGMVITTRIQLRKINILPQVDASPFPSSCSPAKFKPKKNKIKLKLRLKQG
jgi:hypothetical protein